MIVPVGEDIYIALELRDGSYQLGPARILDKVKTEVVIDGEWKEDVVLTVRPHGKRYNLKLLGSTIGVS